LLTKGIHFEHEGTQKIAKWDHVKQFYLLDTLDDRYSYILWTNWRTYSADLAVFESGSSQVNYFEIYLLNCHDSYL
jgi:hypothetical protein